MPNVAWAALVAAIAMLLGLHWHANVTLAFLFNPLLLVGLVLSALMLLLVQRPWSMVKMAIQLVLPEPSADDYSLSRLSQQLIDWSVQSRRGGFLTLEHHLQHDIDPFTRQGITLLVDGADVVQLKEILQQQLDVFCQQRMQLIDIYHLFSKNIVVVSCVYALGCLVVFENEHMQLVLLALSYAALISGLICLPLASRLAYQMTLQKHYWQMSVTGLMSLAQAEHSLVMQRRLAAFTRS